MDIQSYLLGKNSAGGGGGGGSDLDWTALGYTDRPQAIDDGYNYAKKVQKEWLPNQTLYQKFKNDANLIFMPYVETNITTNMSYTFDNCQCLLTIPLLDTSNVTNMNYIFRNCYSLKTIPTFNVSKLENASNSFYGCNNISNEGLINILQMCINATSYTGTKTLKQLGFSSGYYPVSRIEALPHYQAFLDAGWTIGY